MSNDDPETEFSLPHPTLPEKLSIVLTGSQDQESGTRFGEAIGAAVGTISRWINLERLDGITVAFDYDDALAKLDRGYAAPKALFRTSDGNILGVAMTPLVVRNGRVKAHMVFFAPFALPLLSKEDGPEFRQALGLLAHECAHVENWKHLDDAFPGSILQAQYSDIEDQILDGAAGSWWDEYAACRTSASFAPEQTALFGENVLLTLSDSRTKCDEAIIQYRLHADVNRVLQEVGEPLTKPLRMVAYLLGHLDGLGHELDQLPEVRDRIDAGEYGKFLSTLRNTLRSLWSQRGRWKNRAAFNPLKDLARDLFADAGISFEKLSSGAVYVHIPITPCTIPKWSLPAWKPLT